MMKKNISILSMLFIFSLSSCFDEYDEGYDLVGRVASIPFFTISTGTAAPGNNVTADFRYFSEHELVTELRLIQTIDGVVSVADSKQVTGHNLRDSYEDSFIYTVPTTASTGTNITLQIEVVTANDLSNRGNISRTVRVE